jgi:hypothetical protein
LSCATSVPAPYNGVSHIDSSKQYAICNNQQENVVQILWYLPGLIAYSPLLYKLVTGSASFEPWMLLLIPFFFILNLWLSLIMMKFGFNGLLVWREIKNEKRFYGLAYVILLMIGPLIYVFFDF